MSERRLETGWDNQAELVIESAQQLAQLLKQTTGLVKSQKNDAIYNPAEPDVYGDGFDCTRKTLPYLPVYEQSWSGVEHLGLVKINAYWFGSGLLDPFAYEIYSTKTTMTIDDFWKLKLDHPERNIDQLFTGNKIATVGLTVAPVNSGEDNIAEYLAVDANSKSLGLEAIDTVSGLVRLYQQQAVLGVDVPLSKLKDSLVEMPAIVDLVPRLKSLNKSA